MRALCRDCCEFLDPALATCPGCGSARLVRHDELERLSIAHIDCDAFYASVEKRDRPELAADPLIVGHAGGRGVVTTACYIARKFGVRSAMPMFQALERCPEATVIPPDMAKYRRVGLEVRDIFREATETIEPVSLDEAYLDFGPGHARLDMPAAQALALISHRVESEVGITVSIGLAPNKLLAKLASEKEKPRGFSVIGRAEARSYLARLPVAKINGVGPATQRRLEAAGIVTIADLQAVPEAELVAAHGKLGRRLAHFAVGDDDRQVTPDRPTKSISAETTFRRDTGSAAELMATLEALAPRVAASLERKGLAASAVVVKLKTARFQIVTRTRRLPNPTQRAAALVEAARLLVEKEADGRLFRLAGIGADGLVPATEADPPDLFGD
ncbi:MAG: DNA polymerase IV [Proteobacteria bacterium]|nr:DNA polymerase IV [Pseudomonadota bacterium]